ncbi:hypothetical protein Tco_0133541 [Tanacetum coccineum]
MVPSNESQRNKTDHSVVVSNSLVTDYDSANEFSVYSTPLPPLEKLTGAEPVSRPETIKSLLKSKSTLKAKTLKAPAGKLKNVKIEDDPPLDIVMKQLNELKLQISKNKIISLKRGIKPRNPQHVTKNCETCGSNVHTTSDHNDIKWFRKKEALQAKKVESFKASKTESSSVQRLKTSTKRIYGEVRFNTFRNVIGAHYLPHSSEYVAPPSIDIVRPWFETNGYGETVFAKRTLKKSLLPPRWRLLMAQIIQCLGGKTGGFDQISNKDAIRGVIGLGYRVVRSGDSGYRVKLSHTLNLIKLLERLL